MKVDYQRNDKTWSYLHYNQFSVGSASEEYPLTVGGFTGLGNHLLNHQSYLHNGMKFSTTDNDNNRWSGNHAADYNSGWWYDNCHTLNINTQPPHVNDSILFSEMKIHLKDCIMQ